MAESAQIPAGFEFLPSRNVRWRRWKRLLPEVALVIAGLVIVLVLVGGSALAAPFLSVDQVVGLVITGFFVGTLLFLLDVSSWSGLVSIANGSMRLPFPIRRANRSVTRRVPLAEIVDINPSWEGLDVRLADGTRFFVPRSGFGANGVHTIEQLCAPFGKSFFDSVSRFVSEGLLPLFTYPKRFGRDSIRFDVALDTFSDRGRRVLHPEDVAWVQPVSTRQGGDVYRFELTDGTPCLMARGDVDRLGIFGSEAWRAKLRRRD